MSEYTIKRASEKDINFIVEAIVGAEKSGSNKWGFASMMNLSEQQACMYIRKMLEEDSDGCEYSLSNFLVASIGEETIATVSGWIEGENEDNISSATIKSNLFGYILPLDNIKYMATHFAEAKNLQIERKWQTLQIEYVYVRPEYRGKRLAERLISEHIERFKKEYPDLQEVYIQLFGSNNNATSAYERMGFLVHKTSTANSTVISKYFPDIIKVEMIKHI